MKRRPERMQKRSRVSTNRCITPALHGSVMRVRLYTTNYLEWRDSAWFGAYEGGGLFSLITSYRRLYP